jgi:tetratricopeptide (TPR) repeat protein
MAEFIEDQTRNVIPRWRDFKTTIQLGDLNTDRTAIKSTFQPLHDLSSLTAEWTQHRSLAFAGDLMGAAVVAENTIAAKEAAEFVLQTTEELSPSLYALAMRVRKGGNESPIDINPADLSSRFGPGPNTDIAGLRARIIAHPSDAILWMDFGYFYATQGMLRQAERAVRIALNLMPTNRFVLRSAARFFIHAGRIDIAHDLILRAPNYKVDPWLSAAEIAVALSAKRTPRSTYEGMSMIASGRFSVHHLSELHSALGSQEFEAGSVRKARKLFRQSLVQPTDNSLAQAKWMAREINALAVNFEVANFEIQRPFEAEAYEAFTQGRWPEAYTSSLNWLADQPFSSRPAQFAAYLATTIFGEYQKGLELSDFGLKANPGNVSLRVNRIYCLALIGHFEDALKELRNVKPSSEEEWVETAVEANYGLIAFLQGNPVQGRQRYESAISIADCLPNKKTKVMALVNWAKQESVLIDSRASRLYQEARELSKEVQHSADLAFILDRLGHTLDASI